MLVIRKEQIRALEEALVTPRYEAMMLAYMRRHHGAALAGSSDAAVLALVRALSARARSYGALDASGCGQFVELAMSLGTEFDRDPWAAAILTGGGADATSWAGKLASLMAAIEAAVPQALN